MDIPETLAALQLPPQLQNSIPIQDYTYTYTNVAKKIKIRCIQHNLHESAIFSVDLYDNSNNHITTKTYTLDGDDYSNSDWGKHDTELENSIANALGLIRSS